jgi:hypothetical protein
MSSRGSLRGLSPVLSYFHDEHLVRHDSFPAPRAK